LASALIIDHDELAHWHLQRKAKAIAQLKTQISGDVNVERAQVQEKQHHQNPITRQRCHLIQTAEPRATSRLAQLTVF
jgi:hypothetical protein